MLKQKILLTVLAVFLVVGGIAGFIYFKNKSKMLPKVEVQKGSLELKMIFCANQNNTTDFKALNKALANYAPIDIFKNFSKEEVADISGYYFCMGLVNNDSDEACGNKLRPMEAVEQCKNSFYFNEMIIASLNGEKTTAEDICMTHLGGTEFCNYVGSFEDAKNKDACANSPENEKPSCRALVNSDDSLCKGSQSEEDCFVAAKFLKAVSERNNEKCDELFSLNPISNYDITCKLSISKQQDACLNSKYKKFIQSYCK